ncbi:RIP metalloprotease RseP [Helicobacter trogontum]|uniref:Zinc metalloprotease n=1 Tax=Helicobacter trogontum TaxID=50960 RepID=A0A4U8TGD1_9HELI|nr:RIP metalloprotease RseP [Helicobacter trogontum]MCI5786000.1 RIP metalloprotease RseP [Helicobacter trogontum]MDY5185227.1 RIP metalloprotease RseP [Helicobacter trogontum]TLD99220.1 RIP metalloprotease RseP [Helicobacter trogontum]
MGLLFAILGLSFLIFFHELGHFLFARLFGVRVLVFSIGFGKKLISKHYKGTEYALSVIPLGGYVKLKGETEKTSKEEKSSSPIQLDRDSLLSKHPLQRILILLAGPLFNFILAFMIYIIVPIKGVETYSHEPIVGGIGKEYLAYNVLKKGDKIISINDVKIEKFSDIGHTLNDNKPENMEAKLLVSRLISSEEKYTESNKIDSMHTQHNRELLELFVPLSRDNNRVILGIKPITTIIYLGPMEILQNAALKICNDITLIYKGLRDMLIGLIGIEQLSGVVGIADVSAKAYNSGFVNFMLVLALISVNLGVINLLPIPIVDGGQILFTLYEWITGRVLREKIANTLVALGLSLIITLMLLGLYNDIVRIMGR